MPGDVLEIEFTDIVPELTAFSAIMPGLGFLRDVMTEPFVVHWQIARRLGELGANSRRAHPGRSVHGRLRRRAVGGEVGGMDGARAARHRQRRPRLAARSRAPCPPGPAGSPGLRTLPPRENGGNFDVKQLTDGSKLFLPVFVRGRAVLDR